MPRAALFPCIRQVIWLLSLAVVPLACLGDDAENDGAPDEELGSASGAVTACRPFSLDATHDPSTGVSVAGEVTPTPRPVVTIPATIGAVNPHPDLPVVLTFRWSTTDTTQFNCTYRCPSSGGACTSTTLDLEPAGCSFGSSYPGTYAGAAFAGDPIAIAHAKLWVRTESKLPSLQVQASVTLQETGPCPSGCPLDELDDGIACTIDQCVDVEGEPTVVRTSVCNTPLPGGAATTVGDVLRVLLEGDPPVQRPTEGAGPISVEPRRAAGITGRVLRHDGVPAAGARVSVAGHPEYGWTEVDGGGEFVMMVEGGGHLTIDVGSSGYLPVHRRVRPDWQGWARADDVVLTPETPVSTTVALATIASIAVARGSYEADAAGERQGSLFFRPGATAQLRFADGSTEPLSDLTVRVTEYTVGEDGPARMPAPLPPQSAYTYAVELAVDEARGAGPDGEDAVGVEFGGVDQPVVYYLDATSFLEFGVGQIVPNGRYDRQRHAWIPQDNGRVVRIVSHSLDGGSGLTVANVDATGDGTADAVIDGFALSLDERAKLAELYPPDTILWRAPLDHFSPCDLNWPYANNSDCQGSSCTPAPPGGPEPEDCVNERSGSIIECENQVLGESVPLVGTGLDLNYRSDRTPGHAASRLVVAPITGGTVSATLLRADVTVDVAGVRLHDQIDCSSEDCLSDVVSELVWDGRDRFGRPVLGRQPAVVTTTQRYPVVYGTVGETFERAFARARTLPPSLVPGIFAEGGEVQRRTVHLGGWDARTFGLGGWTLGGVHVYDPISRTVFYGDGSERQVDAVAPRIRRIYGTSVGAVAVGPDGTTYMVNRVNSTGYLRRLSSTGVITELANCSEGNNPLPCPGATTTDLQVASDGTLFVLHKTKVYKVAPGSSTFAHVAGNGAISGPSGDGGPATTARLVDPLGMAVAADGTIYLGTATGLRQITPDGFIETVYAPVKGRVTSLAVAPDGSVAFVHRDPGDNSAHDVVRRWRPDGTIEVVAGRIDDAVNTGGEGVPATVVEFHHLEGIAVDRQGTVYVVSGSPPNAWNVDGEKPWGSTTMVQVVRAIRDGKVHSLAGRNDPFNNPSGCSYSGDGGPAASAELCDFRRIAVHPSGALMLGQGGGHGLVTIEPALPGLGVADIAVPDRTGRRVDVFEPSGRHVATRDALTGAILREIEYDAAGRVARIADRDGRDVVIDYTSPTNVVVTGPDGDATTLSLADGWLVEVTNPEGEAHTMGYHALQEGLLAWFQKPGNAPADRSTFTYDDVGRLIVDTGPTEQQTTLTRVELADGWSVRHTTPLGYETDFEVVRGGGSKLRTVTNPSGLSTATTETAPGIVTSAQPDGAIVRRTLAPDPRFGMLAPYVRREDVELPGGPTRTIIRERSVSWTTPEHLWDFASVTEKTWINPATDPPTAADPPFTRTYDPATGLVLHSTPEDQHELSVTLDAKARPVLQQLPSPAAPIAFSYDQTTGRLMTTTQGTGLDARTTTRTYRASDGRLDTIEDPIGATTQLDWDGAGRPLWSRRWMEEPGSTDDEQTFFAYDDNGNLVGLAPPGRPQHVFGRDARDLVTLYDPPDPITGFWNTIYEYDADGRLDRENQAGYKIIDHQYDATTGLLRSSVVTSSEKIERDYDAAGRLQELRGPRWSSGTPVQTLTRGYLGSFLTSDELLGATQGIVRWAPDDAHRVGVETVDVVGGFAVTHTYDEDGLLATAGDLTITRYPGTGRIHTITSTAEDAGQVTRTLVETRAYDAFGGLQSLLYEWENTILYEAIFARDDLGRIETKTETIGGITDEYRYDYDLAGRLRQTEKNGSIVELYTYDANGNRLTADYGGGAVLTATYDVQDRITSYASWTYSHRTNGNIYRRMGTPNAFTLTYDAFGNLRSVVMGTTAWMYEPDARGRRVRRTFGSSTFRSAWLWRSDLAPVAQLDATQAVVQQYIYSDGVNVPDLVMAGTGDWRLIKDQVGSVRLVVDMATGTILRRLDFDSFGRVLSSSGQLDIVPFGFAGGMWDKDTGLVRFGARDYDPEMGRWTAKDPIRFAGGDTNIYAYVGNDPVNRTDPTGLSPDGPSSGSEDDDLSCNPGPPPAPDCREPSWCEEQYGLCDGGCAHATSPGGCSDCCQEAKNACLACSKFNFKRCGT